MVADLTYNIAHGRLKGRIGGMPIDCYAGSGGRSGTKTKGAFNSVLANNVMATHIHQGAHVFGPLPQGWYWLVPHEKNPNMIRLNPFPNNHMFGRNGFLIHGRGEIGSHGCIVPPDFQNVLRLCSAVAQAEKFGTKPTLQVVAVGTELDRKVNQATHTA